MTGHLRTYELKNGSRRWAIVLYLGKRLDKDGKTRDAYRWVRGFQTKREADAELRRLLRTLDEGTYVEPSKEKLNDYFERWLTTCARPNVSAKTYERYRQIAEAINESLGNALLAKLQPVQIAEFYASMLTTGRKRRPGGLSAQTVLHYHRVLSEALEQAVKWQLRPTNPCHAVEAPRPEQREMKALNEERTVWLLRAAEGTEFYLPILMGLCTGLRRGEILGVRWSDISIYDRTLTVNQSLEQTRSGGLRFKSPKSKRGRRKISIPGLLVDALEPHRHEQANRKAMFGSDYKDHGLVVCLADGSPWPPDSFSGSYVYFAGKIGAGGVRFHDLRHTHASQLLRQGTPVKTVSQRLGHSTAAITLNVYAHVLSGDDERATDAFDRALKVEFEKLPNQKAN